MRNAVWLTMLASLCAVPAVSAQTVTNSSVAAPLLTGDRSRGAEIVASRAAGLCVLCHAVPGVPASQQGTLAPPLAGAGSRWTADQLRERLVRPERFNPDTLMPSFRRSTGFERVALTRQGQALFDAQQLEDVVAYLVTLK